MKYSIGPGRVENIKDLIARGGEGGVFTDPGDPNSVLKIYHEAEQARARLKKIELLISLQNRLPTEVVSPLELVITGTGQKLSRKKFAGFRMKRLQPEYEKLKSFFASSFCKNHDFKLENGLSSMLTVGNVIQTAHGHDCLIGDLNHGAIMINKKDHSVAMVDIDSWDIPRFPCTVGSQLYLHPNLYGEDLASGGRFFKPEYDWYSFVILLLRTLIRRHPFIVGMHPKYVGRMARAKNCISMFHKDVTVEAGVGLPFEVLPEEFIYYLEGILTHSNNEPFELARIKDYRSSVVSCSSCGQQYSSTRRKCPSCSDSSHVPGSFGSNITELLFVKGSIVYVQTEGSLLRIITDEKGALNVYTFKTGVEIFKKCLDIPFDPNMRFGFVQDFLCITFSTGKDVEDFLVMELTQGKLKVEKTSTGTLGGRKTVYGVSRKFFYRTAEQMLMRYSRESGTFLNRPVAQVFPGQSFIWSDFESRSGLERVVVLDRSVTGYRWRLVVGDKETLKFNTFDLKPSDPGSHASMQDVIAYFSSTEVLLVHAYKEKGEEFVLLDLFDKDRTLALSKKIALEDRPELERIRGWAFAQRTLMRPTDKGVAVEHLDGKDAEPTILSGTLSSVDSEDSLFPFGKGLVVQRRDRVLVINP